MPEFKRTQVGFTDTMKRDLLDLGEKLSLGAPGGRLGATVRFCCASYLKLNPKPGGPSGGEPSPLMVACGAEGPAAGTKLGWPRGLCVTVQGRFDCPENPAEAYADRFSAAVVAGRKWLAVFDHGASDSVYHDVDRTLAALLPTGSTPDDEGAA